jgi:hypothetical protein
MWSVLDSFLLARRRKNTETAITVTKRPMISAKNISSPSTYETTVQAEKIHGTKKELRKIVLCTVACRISWTRLQEARFWNTTLNSDVVTHTAQPSAGIVIWF